MTPFRHAYYRFVHSWPIRLWASFWAGSFGSAVAVTGTVLIGIAGTALYPEVRASYPIALLSGEGAGKAASIATMEANAKLFWLCFFGFLILILVPREFHRIRAERRIRLDNERSLEHLRTMVMVMPRPDFLERSAEAYQSVAHGAEITLYAIQSNRPEDIDPTEARASLNEKIVSVLETIINLAILFQPDAPKRQPQYQASVFWKVKKSTIETERSFYWEGAKALTSFRTSESFFSGVSSLLVQDLNLTTRSKTPGEFRPAEAMRPPLCFGYYSDASESPRNNHPGVPHSLYADDFVLVQDMAQACDNLPYDSATISQIKDFYERNPIYRLNLSIPLSGPSLDYPDQPSVVNAVLSLSCDERGIMSDREKATMFRYELTPFLGLLYRLCWQRTVLDLESGLQFSQYVAGPNAVPGGSHE